jgi:hypothetical protein
VDQVARVIPLPHRYQAIFYSGEVYDQARLARALKLFRNRVSQILSLTLLSPGVQEKVLSGELGYLSTRDLLRVAKEPVWTTQWIGFLDFCLAGV